MCEYFNGGHMNDHSNSEDLSQKKLINMRNYLKNNPYFDACNHERKDNPNLEWSNNQRQV